MEKLFFKKDPHQKYSTSNSLAAKIINPLKKKLAKQCVGPESCLGIFKLSKSVNGKESIPAQSICHMASIRLSHGEGGWGKVKTCPQLEAG